MKNNSTAEKRREEEAFAIASIAHSVSLKLKATVILILNKGRLT